METAERVDAVLAKFRANGGRVTAARRSIVTALLSGDKHQHLTAEEVATKVQRQHPEIAVSTVYRSLDALEELGVLDHVHIGHGPTVYHLAAERHLHLICRSCGEVTEMPDEALEVLGAEIRKRRGFVIEPRHFAINGLCHRCAADR